MNKPVAHFMVLATGKRALASAIGLAMFCTGCAVGPNFKSPEAPADNVGFTRGVLNSTSAATGPGGEAQHFDTAATVQREWWTAFGSPTLNDMIKQAFAKNPGIISAEATLREAHENTAAQFGAYYPGIAASYSPSRQTTSATLSSPLNNPSSPYTLHTAQLSVGYTADVFGLNRRNVESLKAQESAEQEQLEAAYLTLASNITAAAIQQAALQAQIAAMQKVIDADTAALTLTRQQAQLGYASGMDVATQESALAQAQQALPPLNKQLEQTRDLLAVLGGQLPAQGGSDTIDFDQLQLPQTIPLGLPSQLVQRRPDVRAAADQVHAASAEVGVALANRLPQFSLSAAYGGSATSFGQMFSDGNTFWALAGNVTAPLFDFGTLRHRQRAAEAALDAAKAQYHGVVLTAFQGVADSLYALDADAKALAAAIDAETAARKTRDLTQQQLDLGFINRPALLAAEVNYQQAHVAKVQAQAARYMDTAALFEALGGGWQ